MKALEIQALSKNFGGLQVLSDVSLAITAGERVAIIGPNGAGKTTFLSIVTGAQRPSAGHIFLFGQDVTNLPAQDRTHLGLGCSFQINHLFFSLSVLDNMLLALHGLKSSRYQMARNIRAYDDVQTEAQRLLASVDLWEKRLEPVGAISYGEQRKLEIVLGLASQPKLLVLDEPTAGLSLNEIPPFIDTIKNLAASTTVLFTSHDMDVVFGLAERLVVLYYGRIIADGTPEEIENSPQVREIYLGSEQLATDAASASSEQ
jgi:branched-chain amino acid transport system ATP-binding protein